MGQASVTQQRHRVTIPATMRHLTGGKETVAVEGRNIRQVVANLDQAYPGFAERLLRNGTLAPGVAVAVNSQITGAILSPLEAPADIYFVPALGGG
jgi:molybdopterin converting factor small subunit